MKKIFVLLTSLFVMVGIEALAQDQERDRIKKQDRIQLEDHLILRDGSCYLVKNGVQTKLENPIKLNNGTLINPDGSYQLQNQQRHQLRDGECMDMSGNRYLNQNRFNKRVMMTNKQIERVRTQSMNKNKPGSQGRERRGNNN